MHSFSERVQVVINDSFSTSVNDYSELTTDTTDPAYYSLSMGLADFTDMRLVSTISPKSIFVSGFVSVQCTGITVGTLYMRIADIFGIDGFDNVGGVVVSQDPDVSITLVPSITDDIVQLLISTSGDASTTFNFNLQILE
jgi:hypothetical protein